MRVQVDEFLVYQKHLLADQINRQTPIALYDRLTNLSVCCVSNSAKYSL